MFKKVLKASEIAGEELTIGSDSVCLWKKFTRETAEMVNGEHVILMVKIVDNEMGYAVYTIDDSTPYFDRRYEMTLYHIAAMKLLIDHRLLLAEISALMGKATYYYGVVDPKSKRNIRPFTIDMLTSLKESTKELIDNGLRTINSKFKREFENSRPERRFLGRVN